MAFHIDINVAVRRAAVLDRVNFSADIQLRSKRQNAGCNGPALHRHFSGCGRAARPAATADGAVAVSGQFKIAEIFSRSAFQPITCGTVFCTCILHIFCWDRNVTICGTPPPMASRSRIFPRKSG